MPTGTKLVSANASQFIVGWPDNNPAFFDGTRYWVFYTDTISGGGATLKCLHGTSLASMSATNTNGASGDIVGVDDNGKSYSIVFGQIGTTWYAWANIDDALSAATGNHFKWVRWELTTSGLGTPEVVTASVDDKQGASRIAHDYGSSAVTTLYGTAEAWDANRAHRYINANMTGQAGAGGGNFTDPGGGLSYDFGFAESGHFVKLSDGYLSFVFTNGEGNADAQEITSATLSMSGTFASVSGANAGEFRDANYSANYSHAGQADDCQTDDGTYWIAYIDDTDTTNGDYGKIILRKRGNTRAGTWSTISTDVIGSSGNAFQVAVATDGEDIWVIYYKEASGSPASTLTYRKYDVSADSWSAETTLADVQPGYTFNRLATQWRAANDKIVVVWSEDSGSSTYDLMAGTISTATGTTPTISNLATSTIGANSVTLSYNITYP